MSDPLTGRLKNCYSGAAFDVMRDRGMAPHLLPRTIRALCPQMRCAGPVFTVAGRVDETADPHETLLEWTGFLSKAPAGHVVICQPNDDVRAHMGELSAETLQSRGVLGFIADGGCRDIGFIRKTGFPVFCRYFTPRDIVGAWLPAQLGGEIRIGEQKVAEGDYVIADEDGIVILPGSEAESIVAEIETVMAQENLIRTAIRGGQDPQLAYLKFGKF